MLLADNHFTPIIGIDIHPTVPPSVNPFHPFIGMVMDPMDYIPFIGATVNINGNKRGVSDTSGMLATLFHIPLVGAFVAAPLIGHESMNFFSSETVYAEGTRLSPKGFMVMSCNDIGIPLSIQPGKGKGIKGFMNLVPTRYAPTSMSLPIPSGPPVNVAPPYSPDVMGMVKGLAMSFGFGAIMRVGGKLLLKLANKLGKGSNKMSRWLCKLGFEPINFVTGAVTYEGMDFEFAGPIPFRWERVWDSDSAFNGFLGHGTHWNYDRAVELYPEEEAIGLRMEDGRLVPFPWIERNSEYYLRSEQITLQRKADGTFEAYDHKQETFASFEQLRRVEERDTYQLSTITDHRGFTIQLHYKRNIPRRITDSAGRTFALEYNDRQKITKVTLVEKTKELVLISYAYDTQDNLIAITDALDKSTTIQYEGHLMVQKTDRNGQNFYWEYQGEGVAAKCIHTWGDGGWQEGWMEYHPEEGYNRITDSNGIETIYYYTPEGLVTQIKNGEGHSAFTEYTEHNEVYREIDEEGNTTGFTYNDKGQNTSIVYPDGTSTKTMYNEEGRVVIQVDAEGNKQNYVFDTKQKHLLKSLIAPDNSITTFTYNEHQLIAKVKAADNAIQ